MAATRFPSWLRRRVQPTFVTRNILEDLRLNTVCVSARCPNLPECFSRRTATFMILGECCTRRCLFCAVPRGTAAPPEADEPSRVAEAVQRLALRHVVVTSVARDDLPDGGAGHFARVIRTLRETAPHVTIEVLTPDFKGETKAVQEVVWAGPDVFNHNIETVARLQRRVRPYARYDRSLGLLRRVKRLSPRLLTKSGLMVGMGETTEEVLETLADLREAGCDLLTVGQYLQSDRENLPVAAFVTPETFRFYEDAGRRLGFRYVFSGPFVRSSYLAETALDALKKPLALTEKDVSDHESA